MVQDANLEGVIQKISKYTSLSEASIRNLLHFEVHHETATRLGVTEADLRCVLEDEGNYNIAQLFDLHQADIDNLLIAYKKEFVLGMLVAKLILEEKNNTP
jgi:hypothetical protein